MITAPRGMLSHVPNAESIRIGLRESATPGADTSVFTPVTPAEEAITANIIMANVTTNLFIRPLSGFLSSFLFSTYKPFPTDGKWRWIKGK